MKRWKVSFVFVEALCQFLARRETIAEIAILTIFIPINRNKIGMIRFLASLGKLGHVIIQEMQEIEIVLDLSLSYNKAI